MQHGMTWPFLPLVVVTVLPLLRPVGDSPRRHVVAIGKHHTCAVTPAGGVRCWGDNESGKLGDGTTTARLTPVDVKGLVTGVVAVTAGDHFNCALTASGGVQCWGDNAFGQLGDGKQHSERSTAKEVKGLASGAAAVVAGGGHTCALTTGGGVKCWGVNDNGQLGDGSKSNRTTPTDVAGLGSGVTGLAAGIAHTCAVTSAGGVKCWGTGGFGSLGDGTRESRSTPTDVGGLMTGVAAIAAGQWRTCAVTTEGGMKCWGDDPPAPLTRQAFDPITGTYSSSASAPTSPSGPTDIPDLSRGVITVVAGVSHTCALTTNGGVKCWGANGTGQLGDGTLAPRARPSDVAGLGGGVVAVAAGGDSSCALTTDGTVKCWGGNSDGQLGDGTRTHRTTPTEITGLRVIGGKL